MRRAAVAVALPVLGYVALVVLSVLAWMADVEEANGRLDR